MDIIGVDVGFSQNRPTWGVARLHGTSLRLGRATAAWSTRMRFTAPLIERQRAMYSSDRPFLEKWSTACAFQEDDLSSGYSKIWLGLQAMAWNRPELRARIQQVNEE